MSRTIERTPFMWEKSRRISVVPDPRAACHARGQYSGLVSASGIQDREMGVTGPSSRRDGSEGKWMCPPFLTHAKATQASLQCGTEPNPNRLLGKATKCYTKQTVCFKL